MDGLLTALIHVCGRFDLLGEREPESAEAEQAPLVSTDVRVNDVTGESGSRGQNETALALNETTGTICSGFNDSYSGGAPDASFTGFARSTDGGATFSDRGQLAAPAGQTTYGDPAIVWRKSDGKFYMAAIHSSLHTGFWRSNDDCMTFTWIGLTGSATGFDDKELLAVDNTPASPYYGRIYLAWTRFGGPTTVQETHTSNGGTTWLSPPNILYGDFGAGAWPAVAPNGNAYIAWVVDFGSTVTQLIARSTDGGASWNTRSSPAEGVVSPRDAAASGTCGRPALNGNIRYLNGPQIAIGPDNVLHVVYGRDPDAQDAGDVADVYYRRSTDGAGTWGPEHRLNDDATTTDQFYPALSVGPTNVVSVGWYDRRDDASNLRIHYYATTSYDGGLTWRPNVKVSDVDSPVVIESNCYHSDYDTHVQTATHIVRQWGDDRPDGSGGDNANVYADVVPTFLIFVDGFEPGNYDAWSVQVP